ncbi:unnamed protein product [Leptosia nina]|uniref:Uncharacterized protein n=1 Tax=Leptosia nina TaxID=320188 RepID=A0AAV1J726_9NEOP
MLQLNHNTEFTATACAIRQIWSGNCRLSCRQSQYSGYSGLSGLQTSSDETPGTSQARPACVCDTCPCALIDNVLSTCRPFTNAYYEALGFVSEYTCYVMSVLATKQFDSSQNLNFGSQDKEEKKSNGKVKAMKSLILRRKSVAESRAPSIDETATPKNRSLSGASKADNGEESSSKPDGVDSLFSLVKPLMFIVIGIFVLYLPLGDPQNKCCSRPMAMEVQENSDVVCNFYLASVRFVHKLLEYVEFAITLIIDILYEAKLKVANAKVEKDDVDKVIEDEITQKLGNDLLQSIERKFQVDLERSVDMVLIKIKLLLQNGTQHIQERLLQLQSFTEMIKSHGEEEVTKCLTQKQNDTSALAEKALHQMVVCGYALIGQDPGKAVRTVSALKTMITDGVKPINEQKNEIYGLLRACGHDHDSLKKVVKCVISKVPVSFQFVGHSWDWSPLIKSTMMEITGKLVEGVVDLTKQMAHGAMHEACLIEVIKTIEDEAMDLIHSVRDCAFQNITFIEFDNYIADNNATVLDIERKKSGNATDGNDMQTMLRGIMEKDNTKDFDSLNVRLKELHEDLNNIDNDFFTNNDNKKE